LATELNKTNERRYPNINDIAMIKDWLMGSGWPEGGTIVLSDLDLGYALMASKEWHDAPTGPAIGASEIEKKVVYSFGNGSKIVYEPIASIDPVARRKLGQKLGLCLGQGAYSDDEQGRIYSLRSPSEKAGACIRISSNLVMEIKGPGNRASSITVSNAKMIKEWIKDGDYGTSRMGKADYDKMPPTTWEEAKAVWDKRPIRFLQKGWFRGYREEFKPELIKTLNNIFSEGGIRDHSNDQWLLTTLLKEQAHHVYLNEFAKHLNDIARVYPELYLLNNLPKTYSSSIFLKTHEDAVDSLTNMRPNKIIDYLNPKFAWRGKIFDDNIMNMMEKREEIAVHKIVGMSEKSLSDSLEWSDSERKEREEQKGGYRTDGIDNEWMIMSLFKNSSILKKYPDLAENVAKNLENIYENKSPYPFYEVVKGAIDSRLYRRGGIFKEIVDEAVVNIENSLGEPDEEEYDSEKALKEWAAKNPDSWAPLGETEETLRRDWIEEDLLELPASADEFNVDPSSGADPVQKIKTDPNSFFRLGLHMTKEYKHLTESISKNIADNYDVTKHMQAVPDWNRLIRLNNISDETKQKLANLYLNDKLSSDYSRIDYLRNKAFYKNPLFLETTIRAIKSTDTFRTYAKRRDVERNSQVSREKEDPQRYGAGLPVRPSGTSDSSQATLPTLPHRISKWKLLSFFPRLIKETEGIVPMELTHDMREALVDVARKEDLTTDYETNNFLRKTVSRKNFPELYEFIIRNTLQDHSRRLFSSLRKLKEERHSIHRLSDLPTSHIPMHNLGNMIWDLKKSVKMLHLINKHDLHTELKELPKFIRLFGDFNYKLAEKFKKYIENTIKDDLNPDAYKEKIFEHIGILRMYINFGWHMHRSSYSQELSAAIEEVNKSLFPAIKTIYEEELETKKMSSWRIFGPRTDIDDLLAKYYYNDPDYPESLVYKDEEFIEFLKEELIKLGAERREARKEAFGEFIYGFMYWSVSTFNEMGEEAANQEADIETYIEQMKDIWPKRTGLGYDEFFQKGFNFRDKWERTSYDGPWKPVPYEEEDVEQQLSKDYMQEYYEDLNEPIYEEEEGQEDLEMLKQEQWEEEQTKAKTESVEETEEEPLEPSQEASGGDPEEGQAWRADRPYRLAGFVSGPIKRGRVRKALLSKKYLLNI
jgi:hypothetical protein